MDAGPTVPPIACRRRLRHPPRSNHRRSHRPPRSLRLRVESTRSLPPGTASRDPVRVEESIEGHSMHAGKCRFAGLHAVQHSAVQPAARSGALATPA
jgi:hypothetical protein